MPSTAKVALGGRASHCLALVCLALIGVAYSSAASLGNGRSCWALLASLDHDWYWLASCGHTWRSLALGARAWQCLVVSGIGRSSPALLSHGWSCLAWAPHPEASRVSLL